MTLPEPGAFPTSPPGGGLRERDDLLSGAPALPSSVVNDVVSQSESRRLVLSGSGLINAPISNIRAARSIVEGQG